MKNHWVLTLLVFFLLPSLGFITVKNSAFQQEPPSHKSAAWGFQCITIGDISKLTILETLNTYDTAQKVSKLLGQYGYATDLQKNPTEAGIIQSSYDGSEVFFFIGHGTPNAIGLTNDKCKPVVIFTQDYLKKLDSRKLKFVLLSACDTGSDVSQPNNILRAFKTAGATKVIGFNRYINQTSMNLWSQRFWQYTLQDGMEVSDAAYRASNEIEQMFQSGITPYWLTSDSLVILGTEPVYLGHEQGLPNFSQGWEQFWQDLWNNIQDKSQQIIDQITEKFQAWWAEQWSKTQKSIEEWIQKELLLWFKKLLTELERLIPQICYQPAAMALIFAGALVYRKRLHP